MPLRPPRGTDPYSANVIASMTVDFPEPVGPTSAKNSASAKSTQRLIPETTRSLAGRA